MQKLMQLEIEERRREGIIVLDLKGKLVLGPGDLALRQRALSLLESGHRNLILNLRAVTDIDTTGLGTLAFFVTKFHEAGGRLVLRSLKDSLTRLSEVFKLSTTFEIYPDELDAVNSFFPERAVAHYDILAFVEQQGQAKATSEQR